MVEKCNPYLHVLQYRKIVQELPLVLHRIHAGQQICLAELVSMLSSHCTLLRLARASCPYYTLAYGHKVICHGVLMAQASYLVGILLKSWFASSQHGGMRFSDCAMFIQIQTFLPAEFFASTSSI